MKRSRVLKVASAGAAFALLLTGCAADEPTDAGAAGSGTCQGEPVKIAQAGSSFVYLPFYVAQGSGYLEQEGLVPEVIDLSTGAGIVAGAVSGSVDVALSTAAEVLTARSEGAPVKAFAQVETMGTNIVVKKSILDEAGITDSSTDEERIAVLDGLRVGVTGAGSGSDLVFRFLVEQIGLDADEDVEMTASGSGSNSVAGFTSGRYDAVAISSPQSDIAIERGDGAYLFNVANGDYEPLAGDLYIVAMSSERMIKQKPEVLECFTAALAHAQRDIHENPEAAAAAAQEYMGDIDPALYEAAFTANIPSWPATPVIERDGARAALDFQNDAAGGELDEDLLDEAFDYEIAKAATE